MSKNGNLLLLWTVARGYKSSSLDGTSLQGSCQLLCLICPPTSFGYGRTATTYEIGNLGNLLVLAFSKNLLTGIIPESIGIWTEPAISGFELLLRPCTILHWEPHWSITLSILCARDNSLEGPISPMIRNMSKLWVLDLSHNKFTGFIPNNIMHLPSISIATELSYNLLNGPLPFDVDGLVNLEQLILSGNKLSGEIPEAIGNCKVLEFLLMDDNAF